MSYRRGPLKVSLRASVALIALASGAPMAIAQTAPPAVPTASEAQEGDIVVTGIRQSLSRAAEIKRESTAVVDSIVAEDIGKLPDLTTASALQRVPGVQVVVGGNNEIVGARIRGSSPASAAASRFRTCPPKRSRASMSTSPIRPSGSKAAWPAASICACAVRSTSRS